MKNPFSATASMNFDFAKTKAYAVGVNSLYINLQGRESQGIVPPAEKQALMDDLAAKLTALRDPKTGAQVVKALYQADRVYSGPHVADGPDMVIGYASGYQGAGTLGEFPENLIEDNTGAWCGDHCVATDLVPGVLFSNRKLMVDGPSLLDIAPTVLGEFGLSPDERMKGRDLLARLVASR
jgi:predicted AlkP superfamily phosphohydrolase/phosphomutase